VSNCGDLKWRFHAALYQASGSPIALKPLRSVHDNAARYVKLQLLIVQDVERELSDHHAMLAYARLRDVDMLRLHRVHCSGPADTLHDDERVGDIYLPHVA